jgi:hypothetical protein
MINPAQLIMHIIGKGGNYTFNINIYTSMNIKGFLKVKF